MPICRAANSRGSTCTRTAYFIPPWTSTSATPVIMERRWATLVSAYSSTVEMGSVSEDNARLRTGAAAGFDLCHCGGEGISRGIRSEEHTSELQSPMYL